jgi:hypothetical protein
MARPRRAIALRYYLCKPSEISSWRQHIGSAKSDHPPALEHHDLRRQRGCLIGVVLT